MKKEVSVTIKATLSTEGRGSLITDPIIDLPSEIEIMAVGKDAVIKLDIQEIKIHG